MLRSLVSERFYYLPLREEGTAELRCEHDLVIGKPIPLSQDEAEKFHRLFKRDRHVIKSWRYYLGRGLESGAIPEDWGDALAPTERG